MIISADKEDHTAKGIDGSSAEIKTLLAQAEAFLNQGQLRKAEEFCNTICETSPEHPNALLIQAALYARQGRLETSEKILGKGCALYPDSAGFHRNLGMLYLRTSRHGSAIKYLERAVVLAPDNRDIKTALLKAYSTVGRANDSNDSRNAMIVCLKDDCQKHEHMNNVWTNLVFKNSLVYLADLFQCSDFESFKQKATQEVFAEIGKDELILLGLKKLLIIDPLGERGLLFTRRWLLEQWENESFLNSALPFICALSIYCHFTEYALEVSSAEEALLSNLRRNTDTPARIALLGCYESLNLSIQRDQIKSLAAKSDIASFQEVIRIQIEEPEEEERIRQDIPVLFPIADAISNKVRSQYEENPYPRWKTVARPSVPESVCEMARNRDILIAGCGTGREAAETALAFPYAHITAVDLSRHSLSYGIRKCKEMGINNVSFFQGDILELDRLDKTFDLIICSGVLVCMSDYMRGWKNLVSLLKSSGHLKIALYSKTARDFIWEARTLIKHLGFEGTPDGMRNFRAMILNRVDTDPLKQTLGNIKDFYTLSQCRDLLFHVEEHTFTLPQIESILDSLGLSLLHIIMKLPAHARKYTEMFPEDSFRTNLKNLYKFEVENPYAFAAMYQMWLCRKEDVSDVNSQWIQMALAD